MSRRAAAPSRSQSFLGPNIGTQNDKEDFESVDISVEGAPLAEGSLPPATLYTGSRTPSIKPKVSHATMTASVKTKKSYAFNPTHQGTQVGSISIPSVDHSRIPGSPTPYHPVYTATLTSSAAPSQYSITEAPITKGNVVGEMEFSRNPDVDISGKEFVKGDEYASTGGLVPSSFKEDTQSPTRPHAIKEIPSLPLVELQSYQR
ncbi:hypothetical protein M422DRAFT_48135 [Sphaerobolus stellatus SS14]|uniref:Uncharacterized protein n=1 Tax=Sphaerobolus stellatus (strain SS14) TaxID=990650 RepID=A0A0C9VWL1_SPHS4|nr:hypothetical protein M422DRAFT_48135 [Sphaerobolus stellatus SS14]